MKLASKLISTTSLGLLIFGVFVAALSAYQASNASALSARDFKPGRIIDDNVFYDKNSMNVQQIQDFLNRLIPNCDTWGTSTSEYGGGTRAQYAASRGWHAPPYACLNKYHENPTTHETSFEKGGGAFAGGISAAQIIYNAAQQYGISPKVLLVLLKKESAGPLTADTWPLKSQYKYALGYACPDSGPGYSANCDADKSGFYNQMMLAAWQLKYYRDHPNDYRYGLGINSIQYSPNPSCGTKQVNIENIATLSLYIYTPYVPNDGALANYPGTAPCGAYGNRNFFMFFNEWFGSTYGERWSALNDPRIMVTNKATAKINPDTREQVQQIPSGLEIKFPTKTTIFYDGSGCLRTQTDTIYDANACIPMADLSEFTPTLTDINSGGASSSRSALQYTCKVDYIRNVSTNQCFDASTIIGFGKRVTALGVDYIITKHDADRGATTAFRLDRFSQSAIWSPLLTPRVLVTNKATFKIDPYTGGQVQSISAGQEIEFRTKMDNCIRTKYDGDNENNYCIKIEGLSEFTRAPIDINPGGSVSTKTALRYTCKIDYVKNVVTDQCTSASSTTQFQKKITVLGVEYVVTKQDAERGATIGFLVSRFSQ